MSNLLVVDWDSFFLNPLDGGDFKRPDAMLYDWGHVETPLHIETLWLHRAAGFLQNGLPLPGVSGWSGFWERFRFAEDVQLEYADSNVHAGQMLPNEGDAFASVWLFDAHHDAGYHARSVDEFLERGTYSCEDWMVQHALRGSKLHVRYPQWKIAWESSEPDPIVPVDRALDDGARSDVVFDRVFLCRSGAWVPPWCDGDFLDFVEEFPGDVLEIEDRYAIPREFNLSEVRAHVELFERLRAQVQ